MSNTKYLFGNNAGVIISGHFKREELREISSFIDRMKMLGFSHTEVECTGNGDTGYIFEESTLEIKRP